MISVNSYFPEAHLEWPTKRGHKNLKELIAPARVNTGISVGPNYDQDTQGNVLNVEFVEHRTGVGKESLVSMRVKWSRRVVALKVIKQARFIKSGKILTVEEKI